MIFGMTLAIGSRRLQMFSVLPPLALMLSYVCAAARDGQRRPLGGRQRQPCRSTRSSVKVARPTSSIGLREPRPRGGDVEVGGQREDGQADGDDAR